MAEFKNLGAISKGIFYPGYEKGKNEGPAPAERDLEIPGPRFPGTSGTTITRVVQGSNPLNELNMRKPFG